MTMVMRARALATGYEGRTVATVPALDIAPGDRVIVRGPNGSGKTTVLKTFARLLPPVGGDLEGVMAGPNGAIYVHPAPFLYAGSGVGNVRIGAHGSEAAAAEALEALRATPFARADVRTLSNGQRQRIALARALAAHPALLLVDEADSGLDAEGREAWNTVLATRRDIAIIVATHARHGAAGPGASAVLGASAVRRARCYVLRAGALAAED